MVRPLLRFFTARQLPGLVFALVCATMAVAGGTEAATLIVTNTADSGAGSLRGAIAAASDGDTIQFDAALSGQTIMLTSGELAIDKNITISGPGPNLLTVSASGVFRVFHVMPDRTVMIGGLTIRGGTATGGGVLNEQATLTLANCTISNNRGGVSPNGTLAGGIFNDGTMTITDSIVSNNMANDAGGIFNDGTMGIRNSTVNNNTSNFYNQPPSGGSAGGIENTGTLEISSSTIRDNRADVFGAGIVNNGMMTVIDSTVSGNFAFGMFGVGAGGGIVNGGDNGEIQNSTISNNSVHGNGGGIYSATPLTITNCTISGNQADSNGGGIYNLGTLEIGNTILKASSFGANIVNNSGAITSHGYNLSSDNGGGFLTAPGDLINTEPMLGPLQNNGGPTLTHELLTGSPALNAGDPNFTPPPLYDQRGLGYPRVIGGRIDIGSFEVQTAPPTPTPTPFAISGAVSYCSNPVPGPVPNVTLTLSGTMSSATLSASNGTYSFSVPSGGGYTVTPTKTDRVPGSPGITGVDAIAVQRHFLNLGTPLSGCRLTAADVTGSSGVDGVDAIAIQRFFLGSTSGIANTGKYKFTPMNRSYLNLMSNQTAQNFDTLVFGDVVSPFAE